MFGRKFVRVYVQVVSTSLPSVPDTNFSTESAEVSSTFSSEYFIRSGPILVQEDSADFADS